MPVSSARKLLNTCSAAALSRAGIRLGIAAVAIALGSHGLQTAAANGDTRTLSFHNLHTKENLTVTFKRDGRYDAAALKSLNWFMRDWRRGESVEMNPQLFDLLWEAYRSVGGKEPIHIICGYRSPDTNAMLRRRSSGVAKGSLHTQGQAMDFFIPGVALEDLRNVGLRLQRGGVGFYPTSGSPFVHMDTGNVRHWPRMTHDQLAKVFPDGRTVHVGTDGQPLRNYALALADIEARGGRTSTVALAARSSGNDGANGLIMDNDGRTVGRSGGNLFARLLGIGDDEDEADNAPAAPRGPALVARAARSTPPAPTPVTTARITPPVQVAQAAHAEPVEITASIPLPQARPHAPAAVPVAAIPVVLAAATPLPRPAPVRLAKLSPRDGPGAASGDGSVSDVIAQRGYWAPAVDAPPGIRLPHRAAAYQTASADPAVTASIAATPQVLAYAATEPAAPENLRAAPMGDAMARLPAPGLVQSGASTTIVRGKTETHAGIAAQRFHEPWLRAVMLTPSVSGSLTAAATGPFDPRHLRTAMRKPSSAVMMTFAADPNDGMVTHSFTGSAVVFLATATFGNRTAMLVAR